MGYYRARSHDVLDVADCLLQPEAVTTLRRAFKGWMERYRVPAYDEGTRQGLIRHLYVRTNQAGEALCCVVANGARLPPRPRAGAGPPAGGARPGGAGAEHQHQGHQRDPGPELPDHLGAGFSGGAAVRHDLPPVRPLLLPDQPGPDRAAVRPGPGICRSHRPGDGAGPVLRHRDHLPGPGPAGRAGDRGGDRPEAVQDAQANAARNQVDNARFLCGDAGEAAFQLAAEGVRPQVICVDPPRKGLAPEVPEILASMAPERIVYVSCDPATLARDVKRFGELGYPAVNAQAVDLFPRTAHVETVVLLSQQKPDDTIEIDLDLDELDATAAETKATYEEIKAYAWDKHHLKVSSLYISQIKRKCGLEVGQNYNLSKSENPKVPKCPPEKEAAIMDALKHFQMI